MNKVTPEEAFGWLTMLNPGATHMIRNCETWVTVFSGKRSNTVYTPSIEWPEGVDRWPPPEPTWRVPTDEDARDRPQCRVRDNERYTWHTRTLIAVTKDPFNFITLSDSGFHHSHKYCEIIDEKDVHE